MHPKTGYAFAPGLILPQDVTSRPRFTGVADSSYTVRLASDSAEAETALRLRHEVFNVELNPAMAATHGSDLDFDAYDLKCRHLIVLCRQTGETVGTYRLNSIETAHSTYGFYSSNEFTIEDLPADVISNGIEIGRACIAREHRNTKVLFLLWKALLKYLAESKKRYFFGCCSIFTRDESVGVAAHRQLIRDGHFHPEFSVLPSKDRVDLTLTSREVGEAELPGLFNMYLRIGAKVCGPPIIDREFGTIDFFVVFDETQMNEKYRRLFSR